MSDEGGGETTVLGLTTAEWRWVLLCAFLLAFLLLGGCRSGWLSPADLPVLPP